jgi:glutamate-5-semialdehyde dehydrogenase
MLGLDDRIDLVVPRGSKEFVKSIMDKTHIPVLGHADGVCHTYVDSPVDIDLAVPVTVDSKTQYVAVCNAIETLLVHNEVADTFLPRAAEALEQAGVTLRGCERSREYLPQIEAAGEEDWSTEYLDLILSVKIVDSVEEAIEHVNTYGSRHTDAILTEDEHHADQFMESVDAASVMWNCSTRFADGYRYGLGAEVGISTSKLHARGPVGLEGLVTYKWRLRGKGHIVSDYAEGKRHFTHRSLEN